MNLDSKKLAKKYIILGKLGEGRWGQVFQVKDNTDNKVYALKGVDIGDDSETIFLSNEFQMLCRLNHPNIVKVHDFGFLEDGSAYYTMEWVDGKSINHYFEQIRSEPAVLKEVICQLCDALAYLHTSGIVHSDLKPENILVSRQGKKITVKISDFGLAEMFNKPFVQTQGIPQLRGTYPYMSPEMIKGRQIDHRSDLYSLGVILYELTTGVNPFAMKSIQAIISSHLNKHPQQPTEFNPELDPELNRIILQLLAKEPSFRPTTAEEISISLRLKDKNLIQPPPLAQGMFVGQRLPWKELQRNFEKACQGKGSLVLVEGPDGIGKSRLLDDIKAEFQLSGAHVLEIFGESKRSAFDVFNQLFSRLDFLGYKLPTDMIELLFGVSGSEQMFENPADDHMKNDHLQAANALLKSLSSSNKELDESPLIIIFKNFHFEEKIAWRFFTELAFYWEQLASNGVPCLWIIESRQSIVESMLTEPIHGRILTVEPVSLTEDETGILLSSILSVTPFPEFITQDIFQITNGNPLMINILAKTIHSANVIEWKEHGWRINEDRLEEVELAVDLNRLFRNQIARVPQSLRTVLNHTSLWPAPFCVKQLLITIPEDSEVAGSLKQLVLLGYLERIDCDGQTLYKIKYSSLRDQIHESIPAYERIDQHQKIAKYIVSQTDFRPEDVSYHLLEGDNRQEGCEWAADAGRNFAKEGKHDLAVHWFDIAIKRMPDRNRSKIAQISYEQAQSAYAAKNTRVALLALEEANPILESRFYQKREKAKYLILLGSCEMSISQFTKAQKTFEVALEYLPKTTAFDIRLKLLSLYSMVICYNGQAERAIELTTSTIKELPLEDNPYYASLLLSALAYAYTLQQKFQDAETTMKECIRYGEMLANPLAIVNRYLDLGRIYHFQNRFRDAAIEFDRVISLTRKGGNPVALGQALCMLAELKFKTDQHAEILPILQEAMEIGERLGDLYIVAHSMTIQGNFYTSQGKLDKANTILNKAMTYIDQMEDKSILMRIYSSLATISFRRGNWSTAMKFQEKLLENARSKKYLIGICMSYLQLANIYKYMKNWDKAFKYLDRCDKINAHLQWNNPDVNILRAEIYVGVEDIRNALKYAKKGLETAQSQQSLRSQGYGNSVIGQIYHKQGSLSQARDHLLSALKAFEIQQDVYEIGLVHMYLGELYQTLADMEKSRSELSQAKDCFRHLGADYHLNMVEENLTLIYKKKGDPDINLDPILSTFEEITTLMNSLTDTSELLEKILDVAIRFVNAERGLVILNEKNSQEPIVRSVRNLDESTSRDATLISRTVLKASAESDSVIFSGDAPSDPRFSTVKSVRSYNILSLVCVPLKLRDKIIGAIYVDSRRISNLFSERDRRFLLAFANLAAVAIQRSELYQTQEEEKIALKQEILGRYKFDNMLGKSKIMQEVFQRLESISRTDTATLITGDSGTGKELVARSIHYNSHRRNNRFVIINCAAIPETLVESELFGYMKGAFTDARQNKSGRFEFANGGTLFLDEIGEMPINMQAKLLRAIEHKEITRIGDDNSRKVDVRIIAATNRDLRAMIQEGRFREDFYYRLRVAQIRLPNLVERVEDLPLLASHFLIEASKRTGRHFTEFESKAFEALTQYSWPGNVRELEHAIESAVVFGSPPVVYLKDLPQEIRLPFAKSGAAYGKPDLHSMDEMEEAHIRAILTSTQGNKLKACHILDISRPTLDRKLEKYNIVIKKNRRR